MNDQVTFNRWFVVLGAVLIQLCLGAIYAWSVFTPALRDAGWSKTGTQAVFAAGLALFALVMVWAGRKLSSWGPRRTAMTGGLVLGLGYTLAGLFGGTNFWALLLLIGVVGGSGIGLAYVGIAALAGLAVDALRLIAAKWWHRSRSTRYELGDLFRNSLA